MQVFHHYIASLFSKRIHLVAGVGIVIAIAGFFFTNGVFAADGATPNDQRLVTIHDNSNGSETTIVTRARTVGDALKQAHVETTDADIVEPAVKETLRSKSYQVNIFRARSVIVIDGNHTKRVMTAEQAPKQIAAAANIALYDEDTTVLARADNPLTEGAGLKLTIKRATVITLNQFGKTYDVRTQAATVGELLKEKKITLGEKDGVTPDQTMTITSGMSIKVWRDGVQTFTQEEVIQMKVDEVKDATVDYGVRQVKTQGSDGKKNVTYEIEMHGGNEVSRKEIASVTTLEPVNQVVIVGTKFKGAYTSPSENETITWNYLIAQGFTREQTAGIMGNLKQEHGFNTTGDGLAQWTGGRLASLLAMPDPYNINTQLDFLMQELNGPYAKVRDALKASTTVDQATIVFQNQYERCGVCVESRRIQYAYDILASH